MPEAPLFFLIAGEASGDLLGARLMQALKKNLNGGVRFAGIGGPRMRAEGMDLLFAQEELAHFGLFELLRHVPHLLRRMRQTIREIRRRRPAALITIDAPDFSFRVARQLKGQGIPLIHYVAPTVWAWRPGRARKVAQFLDHLLALLPFEPPYFTREGLPCTFVGHPIVESAAGAGSAERFRAAHAVPAGATLLTVLPGSRMSEVTRLMPIYRETLIRLHRLHPNVQAVIPVTPNMESYVAGQVRDWPVPAEIIRVDADKYDAFAASKAALSCSGTVAIELAMARLPAVIAYKISPLTAFLYRRFIKIKYANLVNLMHDRMVVPELLQDDCTPERLADAVHRLLTDDAARGEQIAGLGDVAAWLGSGQFIPSEKAAETVLGVAMKSGTGRTA
ncbi:MAG: lipid-A-disaccharide synthase [Bdellovibrionales bacterium]